jgi:large subunit ribosomal protein L31
LSCSLRSRSPLGWRSGSWSTDSSPDRAAGSSASPSLARPLPSARPLRARLGNEHRPVSVLLLAGVLPADFCLLVLGHCKHEGGISLKHVHPGLTPTTVRCTSCGNTFTSRSTRSEIVVDVCSNCHPAYTGVERATRSGSRIERFERRRQLAARP